MPAGPFCLRLQAMSFMPTGPVIYAYGPSLDCSVFICYIECLASWFAILVIPQYSSSFGRLQIRILLRHPFATPAQCISPTRQLPHTATSTHRNPLKHNCHTATVTHCTSHTTWLPQHNLTTSAQPIICNFHAANCFLEHHQWNSHNFS